MPGDDLDAFVAEYANGVVQPGDILFVTEKIVAITQGRSYPIDSVQPRKLATFLSKYVTKTSYGIGLGMPETMEMALQEVGTPRILLAAAVGALGKLVGKRGWFYMVAGRKAASIDGPCSYTIPPYNEYVSLAPAEPAESAKKIAEALGKNVGVAIIDQNDLGGEILGAYNLPYSNETLIDILHDNPLGQASQRTPFGIVRKVQ